LTLMVVGWLSVLVYVLKIDSASQPSSLRGSYE
jgi:hypothetical protein